MFCTNCGKSLNEGTAFCPNCGVKVAEEMAQTPVANEPAMQETPGVMEPEINANAAETVATDVTDSVASEEPAELVAEGQEGNSTEIPEAVTSQEPVPVKKSFAKKIFNKKVGIIAGVLLVAGAVVAGAYPFLETMYIKTLGTPKQYLGYVIEKNLDEGLDSFPEIWDMAMKSYTDGITAEETADIEIGDGLTELVEDLGGGDITPYIDWLDTVSLTAKATVKDFENAADIGIKLNNVDLGTIKYGLDSENGSFYMGIPDYNSQYIGYASEYGGGMEGGMIYSARPEFMSDVIKAFPDGEKTREILKKYAKSAAKGVKNVTKDSETLEANGLEQKLTALTVKIDGETAKSVSLEILKELKKDEDIKKIVYDVVDAVGEEKPDYEDSIQEAIDECNEWEPSDDEVELKLYVNGKDEIVGLSLVVEEFELEFVSVRKGNELGERLTVKADMTSVVYEGGGNISGDKLTGEFGISAMGVDLVEINVEDYDLEKAKEGLFNGSITIKVCDAVARIPGADIPAEICDLSLKISGEMSSLEKGSAEVSLLYGNDLCVKISAEAEMRDAEQISMPQDFISIDDDAKLIEWVYGIDSDKLLERLDKAGLPDEYMSALEMAFEYLNNPYGVEGDEYQPETDVVSLY